MDSCLAIATRQASGKLPLSRATTLFASPTINTEDVQKDTLRQSSLTSNPRAFSDFHGLPSNPICIYRTGDEWPVPKGLEAQPVLREARPICKHPIQAVWFTLSKQIYDFLDLLNVEWSTIDPVRFAEEGKEAGPLYLWVGVKPGSLSFEGAKAAADGCKEILANAGFSNVEIAFRESVFTMSTGPQLLNYVPYQDPIADISSPFTPALGIQIAPRNTPHFEGTGALYLRESIQSDRVLVLTARHVALPPPTHRNELYERKNPSKRAEEVLILGSNAYPDALENMMAKIGDEAIFIQTYKTEIEALGEATEGEDIKVTDARRDWQNRLAKAEKTIADIDALYSEITRNWTIPTHRVLGYVFYAPPISFGTGPKQFTEDWALIDLYRDKINWNEFKGNVVYLGNNIPASQFVMKMHPRPKGRSSFTFPVGGLLKIKGVVGEDDIRNPKQLDTNGEESIFVVKHGGATQVTLGRGTSLESIVRTVDAYGVKETSRALGIYAYSHKDGAFSAPGDSGSIVVDGYGRIVGLLTGGAGTDHGAMDVTYVIPYYWIDARIKEVFPDSYLYPMVG